MRQGWGEAPRAWPAQRGGPRRANRSFRLALPAECRGEAPSPFRRQRLSAGNHLHRRRKGQSIAEFGGEAALDPPPPSPFDSPGGGSYHCPVGQNNRISNSGGPPPPAFSGAFVPSEARGETLAWEAGAATRAAAEPRLQGAAVVRPPRPLLAGLAAGAGPCPGGGAAGAGEENLIKWSVRVSERRQLVPVLVALETREILQHG
jgi:hypothetical protein